MPVCKMCGYTASSAQTVCRICGKPLEPTPLIEEPQAIDQTMPVVRPRGSAVRRAALIAAPVVVAAGAIGGYLLFQHSIPRFEQIMPRTAVGVAEVDGPWWWNASADVRAQPDVKKAIESAEKETGISLTSDIAPWIGEIGIGVLNADVKKPQVIACAEVRDWPAFFRTVARLKTKATDETGGKWSTTTYNGVQIQRLEEKSAEEPAVELCWINGWVLMGVGDNSVEKAIDTVQGRSESLSSDAAWTTALGHRPKNWFAWGGADLARLVPSLKPMISSMSTLMPGGAMDANSSAQFDASLKKMKDYDGVTVAVCSDSGNGLRFDSINVPRTEKSKAFQRDLHGTSGPIDGDILKRLPRDSMMATIGHDPNGWWHRSKDSIISQMPADGRKAIEPYVKQISSLEPTLANFRGDSGTAITFSPKTGFGALVLAQASDPGKAADGASAVAGYLTKNQVKVNESAGHYVLPELTSKALVPDSVTSGFPVNFAVCFGAKDGYLEAASTPALLAANAPTGSSLTMPDEAKNADTAAFGDFRLLPDILKAAGASGAMATVNKLGLSKARWDMYVVSAPDGSLQQGTAEIQSWDWRHALKASMSMIP